MRNRQQFIAEAAYTSVRRAGVNDRWGGYAQHAFPLIQRIFGVLRYEYFKFERGRQVHGMLVGAVWKPRPKIAVKLNYQFTDRLSNDLDRGLLAALAFFF